jgi:hypothetical protein
MNLSKLTVAGMVPNSILEEFRSKTLAELNEVLHGFSQSIHPSVGMEL